MQNTLMINRMSKDSNLVMERFRASLPPTEILAADGADETLQHLCQQSRRPMQLHTRALPSVPDLLRWNHFDMSYALRKQIV